MLKLTFKPLKKVSHGWLLSSCVLPLIFLKCLLGCDFFWGGGNIKINTFQFVFVCKSKTEVWTFFGNLKCWKCWKVEKLNHWMCRHMLVRAIASTASHHQKSKKCIFRNEGEQPHQHLLLFHRLFATKSLPNMTAGYPQRPAVVLDCGLVTIRRCARRK